MSTTGTRGRGSNKTVFVCAECGAQAPKWAGQCGECGAWNSLTEEVARSAPSGRRAGFAAAAGDSGSRTLADISADDEARIATGISELDRVLGGGLVRGSVVLIGGDPGIGKSTLLLQAMSALATQQDTLYITGEESLQQVSLRARRLGIDPKPLRVLAETDVERITAEAGRHRPGVMVIDSIQTMFSPDLQAAPGAVSQVRESAARLVQYAKQTGCALFLVGHVTKEGMLAGPRVLEHMVDTVLYFEGDAGSRFRVVRAVKNRFGAVNEVGVFAMTETGLRGVTNPSAIFVSRHETPVSGSVVTVMREGSRPLLLEVQALVAESHAPNPRRVTVGLDQNRLAMLLAVLQRHSGVAMYDQDVFVNIVGGVRIGETAADLPLVLAVLSSLRNRPIPGDTVVFGEIGLAGEIRPVPNGEERIKEAAQHGYTKAIVPKANRLGKTDIRGIEVIPVQRLEDAVGLL